MYHVETIKSLERDCIEDFNKCILIRRYRRTITGNQLITNKITIGTNRKIINLFKSNNNLILTDDDKDSAITCVGRG